jgi:hypothetical protein
LSKLLPTPGYSTREYQAAKALLSGAIRLLGSRACEPYKEERTPG